MICNAYSMTQPLLCRISDSGLGIKYFLVNRQYFTILCLPSGIIDKRIAPLHRCLGNIISKIILQLQAIIVSQDGTFRLITKSVIRQPILILFAAIIWRVKTLNFQSLAFFPCLHLQFLAMLVIGQCGAGVICALISLGKTVNTHKYVIIKFMVSIFCQS